MTLSVSSIFLQLEQQIIFFWIILLNYSEGESQNHLVFLCVEGSALLTELASYMSMLYLLLLLQSCVSSVRKCFSLHYLYNDVEWVLMQTKSTGDQNCVMFLLLKCVYVCLNVFVCVFCVHMCFSVCYSITSECCRTTVCVCVLVYVIYFRML